LRTAPVGDWQRCSGEGYRAALADPIVTGKQTGFIEQL
jgi:hypothetical protein